MSRQTASSGSNHCGNSVPAAQHRRFEVMLKRAENRVCFDCGARQPRWASTNLGVFFCLRCAGIHRSLGVHISKVKSTNMDAWEEPMINFIEHVGNGRGRVLYEYNMSEVSKPRPNTETGVVERVLRAKYERKAYYNPNFTEVLAGFLRTPVTEGEDALHLVAGQSQADAVEAERLREQQRREQEQQAAAQRARAAAAAAASLEELWGAPVTTTGTTTAPAAPTVHDEVAELFASPVPAGHVPQRSSNPFWGMAAPPQSQLPSQPSSSSLNYYGAGSSTGSTGAPSPLGAVFPSPTSNTANSSVSPSRQSSGFPAPAPNPGRAPANNAGSRGASDDLFSSGPPASSSSASPSQQPKDEILSLFASAPPVGSYGGGGGAVGPYGQQPVQGNGAPYSAWQPHMVRPYYHPEK